MAQQPPVGQGLLIVEDSRSHSDILGRSPQDEWPVLPDNTQHSHETDIHAPGGIRTHNPKKRSVADPRLRLRCHWDRNPAKVSKVKWHLSGIKLMQNFMITSELRPLAAVYGLHFDSSVAMTITVDSWQVDVWRCEPICFKSKRHRKAPTAMYFQKKQTACKGM